MFRDLLIYIQQFISTKGHFGQNLCQNTKDCATARSNISNQWVI
jgi:hypothetical protein